MSASVTPKAVTAGTSEPPRSIDRARGLLCEMEMGASAIMTGTRTDQPQPQGLYDPRHEHDACGIGFVAQLGGVRSHEIVRDGLTLLENMSHRGAVGCDPCSGDGAGVLLQV